MALASTAAASNSRAEGQPNHLMVAESDTLTAADVTKY
jgi:hypothetical protein